MIEGGAWRMGGGWDTDKEGEAGEDRKGGEDDVRIVGGRGG